MQPLHRDLNGYLVHHLGPRQAAAARRAAAEGSHVACLTADSGVLEGIDGVTVLPADALPDFGEAASRPGSLELAEAAAERLLSDDPPIARRLARIAGGEEELRCYLARSLLRAVADLNAVSKVASSGRLAGCERVVLDPHWPDGAALAFVAQVAGADRIAIAGDAASVSRRARDAAGAVRSALTLWRDWLPRVRAQGRAWEQRPLLLRHYHEDWGLGRGGQERLRDFDFIVDGETIAPSEVTILSEPLVPAADDEQLRGRGYAVVRRDALTIGLAAFVRQVLPELLRSTMLLLRLARAQRAWREPAAMLISETLVWREAGRRLRPRLFVAYNDLHPSGLARTLGLRRAGSPNVLYEYSCSWLFDGDGWLPDFVYAFAVADTFVSWGPLHTANLERHRGAVGEYWEIGCQWSEHARLVREDPVVRSRYETRLETATGASPARYEAVVAVFDSSVDPNLLDYDDMVAFYAGVAEVAARLPRILFVCKPKRPLAAVLASGRGGPEIASALAGASNVVVTDELFETAAVIGLSHLSISACYTSTGVETIGAGIPAFYFDPTDRFPDAFFRRIPRLVARSADELAVFVVEQLEARGDAGEHDLQERFAALEGRFDGRALTRLRERLRATLDG